MPTEVDEPIDAARRRDERGLASDFIVHPRATRANLREQATNPSGSTPSHWQYAEIWPCPAALGGSSISARLTPYSVPSCRRQRVTSLRHALPPQWTARSDSGSPTT